MPNRTLARFALPLLALPALAQEDATRPESRRLMSTIRFLSSDAMGGRGFGTLEGRIATAYVSSRFEELGLEPAGDDGSWFQTFGDGRNVLARLPGNDPDRSHEVVLIGAHVDHLGRREERIYHGADDNASGVATLIELARVLQARGGLPRSLLFVAFDGEEGGLRGSRHFVQARAQELANVTLMVNLDMVSRNFADMFGSWIFIVGSEYEPALQRAITERCAGGKPLHPMFFSAHLLERFFSSSDHAPFWKAQVPFLFFTTSMHRDYHRPTDVVEKIKPEKVRHVAELVLHVVETAGRSEERTTFEEPSSLVTKADRESLIALLTPVVAASRLLGLQDEDQAMLKGVIADARDDAKTWTEGEVDLLCRKLRSVMMRVMR
ncbi:MAG: M20/M25/M40 family metallo-hydrolase [Planctomycetes bacterium]|nr:M20/M25/M40 family metallo-hydrolase [Planctomycetota bacterium]